LFVRYLINVALLRYLMEKTSGEEQGVEP